MLRKCIAIVMILLWFVCPTTGMAKDIKYFCGWECQSDSESNNENVSSSDVDNTIDTPHEGVEDWYLKLASGATQRYWQGVYYTCDTSTESILGAYILFNNDMTPATSIDFLCAASDKNNKHWCLRHADVSGNADLQLRDANGSLLDHDDGILAADTWYLFEARWKKHDTTGYVVVRVDGVEVFNETGADTYYSTDTTCDIRIEGQQGIVGDPTHIWANSAYVFYDTAGDGDFLGPYQVVGPYSTDHNTATSDDGSNLSAGTWDEFAEVPPNGTNDATMTGNQTGRKQCNGSTLDGPSGDSRIHGDDYLQAYSCIVDPDTGESKAQHGRYDGTYDYTTESETLDHRSGNGIYFADCPGATCPTDDDYALIGIDSDNALGSTWDEAYIFMLQTVPSGYVQLVNSPTLARVLVNGGLIP